LQEPDAFNKIQFPDCHHQVYGIEVLLTTEASGVDSHIILTSAS
jgi:hypothetical protein